MFYGSETWTMSKGDIKRLEAFEMWIWRRMERISRVEHRTNEGLLQIVDKKITYTCRYCHDWSLRMLHKVD